MTELSTPLVAALGARAAELLAAQLSLHTVGDLLRHYPRRYVDRGRLTDIAGLEIGEHITVVAQVEKATLRDMRSRNGKLLAVVIRDEKGAELDCTFFNGHKLKSLVKPGVRAVFSGKVGVFNKKLQLTHPQFETLDEDDEIRPFISVYPATGKLGSQVIARSVRQVLDMVDDVADPLPSSVRERESLAELSRALRRIHVPESQNDIFAARHRLVWDEAMGVQLALALRRRATAARPAAACPPRPGGLLAAFDARLPFALTDGQKRGGGGDRRRSRRAAPDEPARAGRRRRGQDRGGAPRDAAGGRRGQAGRDARAHRGARGAARPVVARAARAAGPGGRARCGPTSPPGSRCSPVRWAPRPSGRRCSMRSPARRASSSAPMR